VTATEIHRHDGTAYKSVAHSDSKVSEDHACWIPPHWLKTTRRL